MNIEDKLLPSDIFDKLHGKDNLDLLNEVKFHKSRMKYKEKKRNSKFSIFKLKPCDSGE